MEGLGQVGTKRTPIIAVDFDKTLSLNVAYPDVGEPNLKLIDWLNNQRVECGAKLILWTCREGKPLEDAIEFCKNNGLTFDAVNENLTEIGFDCRKIVASVYIDDLAVNPNDLAIPYT